jgi:uncharacterized protein YbjT (DUF2867 family)
MTAPGEARGGSDKPLVTVLGGTGFVGRRVVERLLGRGFTVRSASRHPERASGHPGPAGGRFEPVRADVHEDASVEEALEHAQAAVNAVGLYVERGEETFQAVHVEAAARVARLARQGGVGQLVHMSGIGDDPGSSSDYIRARGEGESAVREAFPPAVVVRSAVMFGPDDAFLTTLARLVTSLPVCPMFGDGSTRLQPVYVGDVAEAITRIISREDRAPLYEPAGPRIFTYKELLRHVARLCDARTVPVAVPFWAWRAIAVAARLLPNPPVTQSQISLMQRDNTSAPELPGLPELGIEPVPIDDVLAAIRRERENGRRRRPG